MCGWGREKGDVLGQAGDWAGLKMGQLIQSIGPVRVEVCILAQKWPPPQVRGFKFFFSLQSFYHTCMYSVCKLSVSKYISLLCKLKKTTWWSIEICVLLRPISYSCKMDGWIGQFGQTPRDGRDNKKVRIYMHTHCQDGWHKQQVTMVKTPKKWRHIYTYF